MRFRRVVLLFGVCGVLASVGLAGAVSGNAAASPATGYIYWGNGSAIGRANLDGTGVNPSFISTGGSTVDGVAVDANSIYWIETNTSPASASIGRANLDGTGVNENFITLFFSGNRDVSNPGAITVDGSYVYWGTPDGAGIGRANLNGTGVDQSFISSTGEVEGLAVDGNYIYWSAPGSGAVGAIGRANLDGTSANASFITGLPLLAGVAVDANHVYWTSEGGSGELGYVPAVGRANLDGTGVNQSFISNPGWGSGFPYSSSGGLAVDGDAIFWGEDHSIGRGNIDGSCAASGLIPVQPEPSQAIAVTPGIANSPPVQRKYAVTYVANRATGGSAPVDGTSPYMCGSTVAVLGPGSLKRTGFVFNGWGSGPWGSGTGQYQPASTFSMPASNVTLYAEWARKLSAGKTTCNATFTGTGMAVTVPANGRCTLIPGTHVTGSITVHGGATLTANGVTIGGTLGPISTAYATVCGSRIGQGVNASRGSLALGGPGCAGNKITGNVLVQHDAGNVTVQGNKVTGNLTATLDTGPTDSIVGNTISGKLLVSYSGPPVEVSKNHAAKASCVGNKGQTGSGNVATGTNTCPH